MVSDVDDAAFPQLSGSSLRLGILFYIPGMILVPPPVTGENLGGLFGMMLC